MESTTCERGGVRASRSMPPVASSDATDAELVLRARAGDSSAWDALVASLANRVWAVARAHGLSKADAEDVFQLTWMRLVTHLDTIREPSRVGAWLASTARHESLRILRRSSRQIPSGDDWDLDTPDPSAPSPESAVVAAGEKRAVWEGVAALPPQCQRLLRLFMVDPPMTYEDVSSALNMPIGSIGPTRRRCLERLHRQLTGLEDSTSQGPRRW